MTTLIDHLKSVRNSKDISNLDIPMVTGMLNDTRLYCFCTHRAVSNVAMQAVSMIMTKMSVDHPMSIGASVIIMSPEIKAWLNVHEPLESTTDEFIELIKRCVRYAYRLPTMMASSSSTHGERTHIIDPKYFGLERKSKYFDTNDFYASLYQFAVVILMQTYDLCSRSIKLLPWMAIFYRYMFCDLLDFNKEFDIKTVVPLDESNDLHFNHTLNTLKVIMQVESEAFDVYDITNEMFQPHIYESLYYLEYKHDPFGWIIKECSSDNSDVTRAMHFTLRYLEPIWKKYLAVMGDFIPQLNDLFIPPVEIKVDDDVMQHLVIRNILMLTVLSKWFVRKYSFKDFMKVFVIRKSDHDAKLFHRLVMSREPILFEYAPHQWGVLHKFVLYTHWNMSILIAKWYDIIKTELYDKITSSNGETIYLKDFMIMSTTIDDKKNMSESIDDKKIKTNDYDEFMALLNKHSNFK